MLPLIIFSKISDILSSDTVFFTFDGRNGMLLCLPHRMKGEGQFVAKLRKKEKNDSKTIISLPYERPAREETELFRKQFPGLPVPNVKTGSKFACCPECPELKGIRVLRAGLHLAEIRGKSCAAPAREAHGAHRLPTCENLGRLPVRKPREDHHAGSQQRSEGSEAYTSCSKSGPTTSALVVRNHSRGSSSSARNGFSAASSAV